MALQDPDPAYSRLRQIALDYVKRSGGRRMTAEELREAAAVDGIAGCWYRRSSRAMTTISTRIPGR